MTSGGSDKSILDLFNDMYDDIDGNEEFVREYVEELKENVEESGYKEDEQLITELTDKEVLKAIVDGVLKIGLIVGYNIKNIDKTIDKIESEPLPEDPVARRDVKKGLSALKSEWKKQKAELNSIKRLQRTCFEIREKVRKGQEVKTKEINRLAVRLDEFTKRNSRYTDLVGLTKSVETITELQNYHKDDVDKIRTKPIYNLDSTSKRIKDISHQVQRRIEQAGPRGFLAKLFDKFIRALDRIFLRRRRKATLFSSKPEGKHTEGYPKEGRLAKEVVRKAIARGHPRGGEEVGEGMGKKTVPKAQKISVHDGRQIPKHVAEEVAKSRGRGDKEGAGGKKGGKRGRRGRRS